MSLLQITRVTVQLGVNVGTAVGNWLKDDRILHLALDPALWLGQSFLDRTKPATQQRTTIINPRRKRGQRRSRS